MKAANVEIESYWPGLFAKLTEKRNVEDLIMNCGGSGGGAPVAAAPVAAAGGGAAAAPPPEEKKVTTAFHSFNWMCLFICIVGV